MGQKRGKVSNYIKFFLIAFLIINIVVTIFFIIGKSPLEKLIPEIAKDTTRLKFLIEETNESLDGSIFIKNIYIGSTYKGEILIKNSSSFKDKNLTLITLHEEENYSFSFKIPENIGEIDVMKYVVSRENFNSAYKDYQNFFSKINFPHWGHMPLTYRIKNRSNCNSGALKRLDDAFNLISTQTNRLVLFEENLINPDITVVCSHLKNELEKATQCKNVSLKKGTTESMFYEMGVLNKSKEYLIDSFIRGQNKTNIYYEICFTSQNDVNFPLQHLDAVGLAVPTKKENLIINGTIYLNLDEENICDNGFPLTEIHELLHILGFNHLFEEETLPKDISDAELSEMMKDIMSPWASCFHQRGGIAENYLSCLKYIYSNGEVEGSCNSINMFE